MTIRTFSVWLFLLLVPLAVSEGRRQKWAHESSELIPDKRLVFGELDNGFRYLLLPHDVKPGLVSMRFVVGVGSLDEEEDERGLSHFIEHMAFEGTRNFKPGELIDFFQRLGMSYGVDVNAFTYHDKTVYHLELPSNEAALIEQGLRLYRDYADGILFDPQRTENEREVILREKQARESPSALISQASFNFSFDGTKLAERNPIGLETIIRETSVEKLKSFYAEWYRPDVMTLVVVGDIDTNAFPEKIEAAFGSMEKPRKRVRSRKIGRLERTKPFRTGQLDVEGVERYTLEVSRSWMERDIRDSWKRRETDMIRAFATALFNERCRMLIDGMSENFANYNRVYGLPYCQLTISSGGEYWWDAFVWMDQLLRQALEFGFTQQELEYVRKTWLQSNRAAGLRYETAEPRQLIDELVDSVSHDRVYVSADDFAQHMDEYIRSIDLDAVNEAFSDIWQLKRMSYFMAGDFDETIADLSLKQRFKEDRKYTILPYIPRLPADFEYTKFAQDGEVVEESEIESIGAKTFRFGNNARLTFLHTDNEKDTVRVLVRVGGGMLGFSDTNPGTHALAMSTLFRSSFGEHDIEDVYKELRSNVTSFVFGVDDHDAFTYRGLTQSDGLDEFFKIVSEYLLDPNVDDDAFVLAQSKLKQSRELEPDGMNEGYRALYRMMYPGLPRFHAPSIREISAVEPAKIRDWVEQPFREGYVEVAVVGDVEEDALLELFGKTIGALPTRRASKENFESARSLKVHPFAGRRKIEYEKGMGDNAASVIVWTIQEDLSLKESAVLYVLSSVLETRIRERVREEMGASYSPTVRYVTFPAYDTLRHIRADVDCMKGEADELLDVVLEIASELSRKSISDEELQAAVAPLEEGIRQAWKDNTYLLENVLYGVQEYPAIIDNAIRYRDGLLSSITEKEIRKMAEKYLTTDAALAVAIVPADTSKLAEAPSREIEHRVGVTEN